MATPNYGWVLPTPGGDPLTWDDKLNAVLDQASAPLGVDQVVKAVETKADAALPKAGGTLTGVVNNGAQPRCHLTKSALQSIPNQTATVLTWNLESYDVGALHDNVTNNSRVTVPVGAAGLWKFSGAVNWNLDTDGHRSVRILKNGVTRFVISSFAGNPSSTGMVQPFYLEDEAAEGDFYEVEVNTDGGAVDVLAGSSRFQASKAW